MELNVTDQGFPESLDGLKPLQKAYNRVAFFKSAFATSMVLTPDGAKPLGSSGSGFAWEWRTAANYHPERYLAFLTGALNKFNQMDGAETKYQLN